MAGLQLSQVPEADELLSNDPLALLIGMVLDQQIPLEKAFRGPFELRTRLGSPLDAKAIATMDPEELTAAFCARPALHRFPAANARRVQDLCRLIVDEYDGDPAAIWEKASDGADLLARIRSLPGFGEQKARIFVGLLGKQLGVRPRGWRNAAEPFGKAGTFLSVADIVGPTSLAKVREHKAQMKAAARSAGAEPADGPASP